MTTRFKPILYLAFFLSLLAAGETRSMDSFEAWGIVKNFPRNGVEIPALHEALETLLHSEDPNYCSLGISWINTQFQRDLKKDQKPLFNRAHLAEFFASPVIGLELLRFLERNGVFWSYDVIVSGAKRRANVLAPFYLLHASSLSESEQDSVAEYLNLLFRVNPKSFKRRRSEFAKALQSGGDIPFRMLERIGLSSEPEIKELVLPIYYRGVSKRSHGDVDNLVFFLQDLPPADLFTVLSFAFEQDPNSPELNGVIMELLSTSNLLLLSLLGERYLKTHDPKIPERVHETLRVVRTENFISAFQNQSAHTIFRSVAPFLTVSKLRQHFREKIAAPETQSAKNPLPLRMLRTLLDGPYFFEPGVTGIGSDPLRDPIDDRLIESEIARMFQLGHAQLFEEFTSDSTRFKAWIDVSVGTKSRPLSQVAEAFVKRLRTFEPSRQVELLVHWIRAIAAPPFKEVDSLRTTPMQVSVALADTPDLLKHFIHSTSQRGLSARVDRYRYDPEIEISLLIIVEALQIIKTRTKESSARRVTTLPVGYRDSALAPTSTELERLLEDARTLTGILEIIKFIEKTSSPKVERCPSTENSINELRTTIFDRYPEMKEQYEAEDKTCERSFFKRLFWRTRS